MVGNANSSIGMDKNAKKISGGRRFSHEAVIVQSSQRVNLRLRVAISLTLDNVFSLLYSKP
jgi:hypothetical protein